MSKRKNRLFYLAISVFLPPICIMFLAAAELLYSLQNVENLARSFVESFAERLVESIEKGEVSISKYTDQYSSIEPPYDDRGRRLFNRTHAGFGRIPILFVLRDFDGTVIYGSDRLTDLIRHTESFSVGIAKEVYDINGERFTVTAYPSISGKFSVIAAISWRDLPGSALRTMYLWPLLMACFALWSGMVIWQLWWRVIVPLGELSSELSNLKWGEESLSETDTAMIAELHGVRDSISRVSVDAIRRVAMIKRSMRDIVSVEEAERASISREIHDGPLQDITALLQRIHLARLPGNTEEETREALALAEKIGQDTVKEMRAVCDYLNPPWLELGLQQALTELTDRASLQYGIRIFLDCDESVEFTESEVQSLFRVVQEAITNSVRHGAAKNVWIDLFKTSLGIELRVQDDGKGFVTTGHESGTLRVEGHRGLANMEERMAGVGGHLVITSSPGEGTCVRAMIP